MKPAIFIFVALTTIGGVGWWMWMDTTPMVKVEAVTRGKVKHSSPGRVEVLPERAQRLSSMRTGRVERVIMQPNSTSRPIEAGEVIIQLETEDVELALNEIQASLKAAEARLATESELALQVASESRELEDFRVLAKEGRYPLAELRKKEDALKGLQARLEVEEITLREKVESYRAKEAQTLSHLEDLTIKSPFGGILTEVFVSPGDHVQQGKELGILHSRERLIRIALNEEDFQGVAVEQEVAVSFLSHGDQIFKGEVERLSEVLDSSTNRRHLFVNLDDGNDRFAAGSSGEAEIVKASKKNVILVPRRALVGSSVCIWKEGVLEIRQVKVGHRNLLTAEVLEGLTEGELVVVKTPHLFRNGQRARLAESQN
ncbi:MAG: hypothetical protein CMI31_02630 [Opitutae bacterium]|nr:hypothetical protein [Opitutae bacterium]|tara:strand:+ start:459 stop:1577 length:1119 start_codon:yes stop_codon:yes gene_type:complete